MQQVSLTHEAREDLVRAERGSSQRTTTWEHSVFHLVESSTVIALSIMSFSSFFRPEAALPQSPSDETGYGLEIEVNDQAMSDVVQSGDEHMDGVVMDVENEPGLSEAIQQTEAQASLRRQILAIQNDVSVTEAQKAILMQTLMTRDYVSLAYAKPSMAMQEIGHPLSALDQAKTYFDEDAGILGCPHYQRNCKLQ